MLGTLSGAFLTACIAKNYKMSLGFLIGLLNMLGGYAAIQMIGGPVWFMIVDLGLVYMPMGGLGGLLGRTLTSGELKAAVGNALKKRFVRSLTRCGYILVPCF
jgi:hypothetical protein